ncbi:MAG: YgiT-type zinc finger protein [Thermoleophilia bacterium]|nr:YgiT-type zinc finger protein [Thermoleophilia bacterium]
MTKAKPGLSRCPTCHRKGMRREVIDVRVDEGKRVVRDVEVEICPSCGEQLYDVEAMRKIEAAHPPRRRRRRTSV